MSDDVGDGRLCLDGDEVKVDWPAVGDLPIFDHNADVLRRASAAAGGEHVTNPLWSPMLRESLVTVHPLGGCAMADDGAHGVVDHRGRVFTGAGDEVYEDLLVTDGAIVPRPLAVNPLLTISALSERARPCSWPRRSGTSTAAPRSRPVSGDRPGVRFTERMAGWAGTATDGDPVGVRPGARPTAPHRVRAHHRHRRPAVHARRRVHTGPAERHGDGPCGLAAAHAGRRRLVPPGPGPDPRRHLAHDLRHAAGGRRRAPLRLRRPQGAARPLRARPGATPPPCTSPSATTKAGPWPPASCASPRRLRPPAHDHAGHGRRRPARAGALAGPLRPPLRALARPGVRQPRRRRQLPRPAAPVPLTGAGRRRLRLPAPEPRWCDATGAGTRAAARTAPWATTPGCASSATRAGAAGPCCWPRASACRPRRSCSTR